MARTSASGRHLHGVYCPDLALGVGACRGRIIEIYGPESSARRRWRCTSSPPRRKRRRGGVYRRRARPRAGLRPRPRRRYRQPAHRPAGHRRGRAGHHGDARALRRGGRRRRRLGGRARAAQRDRREMGDSSVGIVARLMSQALRKSPARFQRRTASSCSSTSCARKSASCTETRDDAGRPRLNISPACASTCAASVAEGRLGFVGNRTKARIVKNRSPRREAELDIMYGEDFQNGRAH